MLKHFKQPYILLFSLLLILSYAELAQGQYARGNSPYSRYGLGDLSGSLFAPNASMSGGLSATYRSYWDYNLANPASLGKLRFTSFQVGIDYQHSELTEKNTNKTAQADNGNLSYVSLAFPITKSWEVMRDTLRRGVPVQWGMGVSLTPYSFVNYDVSVVRQVAGIDDVRFNYTGEGAKYRVNWSNGFSYKGISAGANLGMLFGQISNSTYIDFQDSTHSTAFDEQFVVDENGVGFIWDVGIQYEYVIKNKKGRTSPDPNYSIDNKISVGAYAGGVSNITTVSSQQYTRQSQYHGVDTIQSINGVEGVLNMPIKIGGGISYGREMGFMIGLSYESELWSMFKRNDVADDNLTDAHRFAIGMQIIPEFADYSSYFNRVRYRAGIHYGLDSRSISPDGQRYQLVDYGLSVGAGFPMRPPKAKSILGFVNLGLQVGYLGHPELIGDLYFRVNLGFSLNSSGWFNRSKFR
jgi:hypothetical protein